MSHVFAIEGPDFSGKTTVATALVMSLKSKGYKTMYVKEPDVTSVVGRKIYDMLNGKWGSVSPFEYAGMFAASRLESRARLLSLRYEEKPDIVILDRSELSTMVYQTINLRTYEGDMDAYDLRLAESVILDVSRMSGGMLQLDSIFYLDTPLETCLERCLACPNPDENEQPEKVRMSKELYERFINQNIFHTYRIATEGRSPDDIMERIRNVVIETITPF